MSAKAQDPRSTRTTDRFVRGRVASSRSRSELPRAA